MLRRPDRHHHGTGLRRRFKIISVRRRRRCWRPDRRRRLPVAVPAMPRPGPRIRLTISPRHPATCLTIRHLRLRHLPKIPGSRVLTHIKLRRDPPQRITLTAHRRSQTPPHIRRSQHVIRQRRIPPSRGLVAENPPITALQPLSDQGNTIPRVTPDQPRPPVRRGLHPLLLPVLLDLAQAVTLGRRKDPRLTGHGPQ